MKLSPDTMSGPFVVFLRLAAVAILVWVQTGQLKTTPPLGPQVAVMAQVDVSGYGNALSFTLSKPILDLYTNNPSAPLGDQLGLRQVYKFGVYSHCAYVNDTGLCSTASGLYLFQPYNVITKDMPSNYSGYTDTIIRNTTFANSALLGGCSHVARRFLLEGSTVAVMALITGIIEYTLKYPWIPWFSALLAVIAGISALVTSSIWTALIRTAGRINSWTVTTNNVSLGIRVSAGAGLYCTWVASVLLLASIVPYIINKLAWSFSRDGSLYTAQVRVNSDRELRRERRREEGRMPLASQLEHG